MKLLLPSFCATIREDQVKSFLDHMVLIWFLLFPEPEEEVHVHGAFLDDASYDDHIHCKWFKVSTLGWLQGEWPPDRFYKVLKNRLCWLASVFPKNIRDGPIPEDSLWMVEMNKATKTIVLLLHTHIDTLGLEGIELCLEDSLAQVKEQAAWEAQERLEEENTMLHF